MTKFDLKRLGAASLAATTVASAGTVTAVVVDAAPAAAAGCRYYPGNTDFHSPDGDGYWYSTRHHPPSDPQYTCNDIQVYNPSATCADFRIRLFNTSGSTLEVTGWKNLCQNDGYVVLKEDVPDLREYRVETADNRAHWPYYAGD